MSIIGHIVNGVCHVFLGLVRIEHPHRNAKTLRRRALIPGSWTSKDRAQFGAMLMREEEARIAGEREHESRTRSRAARLL